MSKIKIITTYKPNIHFGTKQNHQLFIFNFCYFIFREGTRTWQPPALPHPQLHHGFKPSTFCLIHNNGWRVEPTMSTTFSVICLYVNGPRDVRGHERDVRQQRSSGLREGITCSIWPRGTMVTCHIAYTWHNTCGLCNTFTCGAGALL